MSKIKILSISADSLCDSEILSTGNKKIDKILKGGFRSNILNEIVGVSGSGKTQLCMCLSLMVQLPKQLGGLNKAAVYICTEDVFPIKRFYELSSYFEKKFGIENLMDNVFLNHISDFERLKSVLSSEIKILARFKDIGLIIIDSIAGLFRSDNLGISYSSRSKDLSHVAAELRKLGSKWQSVIICCNQMTDNITTGTSEPCLGLSWSNLVNSRFLLSRSSVRKFEVIFSSYLSCAKCDFSILRSGIC